MVTHQVHDVAVERKRDALTYILKHGTSHTLVFCRTKRGANRASAKTWDSVACARA